MTKYPRLFAASLVPVLVLTSRAGEPAPPPSAPVSNPGILSTSYDDTIRPCLCHGAFAGSNQPFAFDLTVGYDSTYLCRGMDVGDDLFHATATVDYRFADWATWTASFRYHDVTDVDFEEFQAYTGLFFKAGALSIGPSFRWYEFRPGGGEMTAYDLGIQALYKAGPVNITGGYFYETESEGSYAELGVASSFPVTNRISIVPSAQISYTDGWLMPMLSGMNAVDLRVAVPIRVTENFRITPWAGGFFPLEALDAGQDEKFIYGVSLSLTF